MTRGKASFVMRSDVALPASVTAALGVVPTSSWEPGDLVGNGYSGRRHTDAGWMLETEFEDTAEPWDAALLALTEPLRDRVEIIDELRASWSATVWCSGDSDSSQGGFWLSPEVMRRLGLLGVAFAGTICLPKPDDSAT